MATIKSIEEKAKAYDEVRKKIAIRFGSNVADEIFSQFEMSEDEKIRKLLVEAVTQVLQDQYCSNRGVSKEKVIAWLEAQGEQKPVVIPKFRIGDIIKDTEFGQVFTIRTITKDKYIYTDDSFDWIKDQDEYKLVEQKPTDEEMKELLHTEYEKGRADAIEEMQNHTWSEEDMEMIGTLVAIFEVNYPNGFYKVNPIGTTNMQGIHSSEIIKWLKSLKDKVQPQTTWKPSDEQMRELSIVAKGKGWFSKEILSELLEHLKKLREKDV